MGPKAKIGDSENSQMISSPAMFRSFSALVLKLPPIENAPPSITSQYHHCAICLKPS